MMQKTLLAALWLMVGFACGAQSKPAGGASDAKDPPETVIVTYRAKTGKEAQLEKAIQNHWATIKRLGMVTGDLHMLFRGEDEPGKTMFVNILTWKDHAAP